MSDAPASLPDVAGADWFATPEVGQVFALLGTGPDETRIIGGAVRNALMGRHVHEIDFATRLTPDEVMARAAGVGVRAIPTGYDHGTVTLLIDGHSFEVTTLREDVETDGRRAVVRFGQDWTADAERRDFTVNALSVDASGRIHDPLGGYGDVLARRVRFIGEPDRRIAEDRLRILRMFRFHAELGDTPIPAGDLAAAIRARAGLRDLSSERIGAEMRRIVAAARPVETLALMQETGILPLVLAGIGYVATLARVVAFEQAGHRAPRMPLRLVALAARLDEDVDRVVAHLRLSNAEGDAMRAALAAASGLHRPPGEAALRRLAYRHGDALGDGVVLAFAWRGGASPDAAWLDALAAADRATAPVFPLSGRDVTGLGVPPGRMVGRLLATLEAWWIEQDFRPDAGALRQRLQAMVASAQ